ncbi:MAG: alcohol dehydrogenase catalytic domain-containing protein, partial [Thermoplasmata archaeon]
MRAVVVDNGELRFEDRPDPVPGDTEVLVATQAAGLNGADMLQRRGHYPAPPGAPVDIPGMELAGEVVEVGGQVKAARRGDRV